MTVGSWVPAKPSRLEHWGAREGFIPIDPRPSSLRSRGRTRRTHKINTQDLYWFGTLLWYNTLLQCGGGGLPLGLTMNNTKEERPPEVEAFLSSVSLYAWGWSLSSSPEIVSPLFPSLFHYGG